MTKRKKVAYVFLVCAVMLGFYLARKADQADRGQTSGFRDRIAAFGFVGTWKSSDGKFYDFRRDETARSRDSAYPTLPVSYFEYKMYETSLTVRMAPRGKVKRFIANLSGMQTDVFTIENYSENEFTLLDPAGPKIVFTRIDGDGILEDAP